jgi:uncharacterized circularly permuted ATP-grasp superfamily protein/uncharacterized alpha-E superfamily protein
VPDSHWPDPNVLNPSWPNPSRSSQANLPGVALAAGAAGSSAAAHTLLARALPAEPGVWDELRQSDHQLRPAWQQFAQHLPLPTSAAGVAEELGQRQRQVHQRIRQDGVTHNVFADLPADASGVPSSANKSSLDAITAARPWSLELLPHLVEAPDWAQIEAGVVQRAALLELMLADLYGPQTLLSRGLLPPALLHRHPGWLPQLQGVAPAAGVRLYIVAFDLARGPSGGWHLVSQRTQGPSGLGYVLHNRLLIARQFADAFGGLRVQRIAPAYRRLLSTLQAKAATVVQPGQGAPRVVLLTPGPYSETYFEHAYLARYLGLPLVEGGDLTVRGDHLFLKTIQGLEPVHGVMRRLDDDWCDPLELRPDSTLGVPGLLQAARAGTVVMANALGSGFLESPAVQGFMPGVAKHLLGQPLLLPSLATWWCGEAAAWQHVQTQLTDKVLRSTYPRGGRTTQMHNPNDVHSHALQEDPCAWTIQARLRFSRAPIWSAGAVQPRPAVLRVYAMADGNGGWQVMPGGMTRVAQREDASLSMQRGGSSLDTWVLAGPHTQPAHSVQDVAPGPAQPDRLQVDHIAQHHRPVSSRTGENLFWLGRYTERTEQLVRLARATLVHTHTERDAPAAVQRVLARLAVQTGLIASPALTPPAAAGATALTAQVLPPAELQQALLAGLASTQASPPSIAFNLLALERAAQSLRERLSPEQWSLVRNLHDSFSRTLLGPPGAGPSHSHALAALDHLALQLAALTGVQTDRMTRDHGWRLLTVGRLLERLHGVALRLQAFVSPDGAPGVAPDVPPANKGQRATHHPALQNLAGVELLLDLFDSLITFRARYQRHDELLALTDVLVLDPTNPRAFAGVLRRLRTEMGKLPGQPEALAPLLALLPADGAGLPLQDLRSLHALGDAALAKHLHTLAGNLATAALQVADGLGALYFTLAHGADQRV